MSSNDELRTAIEAFKKEWFKLIKPVTDYVLNRPILFWTIYTIGVAYVIAVCIMTFK